MIGSEEVAVILGILGTICVAIIKFGSKKSLNCVPYETYNIKHEALEEQMDTKIDNANKIYDLKFESLRADVEELKKDMKEVKINTSSIPLLITELKAQGKR